MRPKKLLVLAAITILVSACSNPRTEAATASALSDAATEIGGLKSDLGALQDEVDSLRTIVAKQDTSIARIAAVNNIPLAK